MGEKIGNFTHHSDYLIKGLLDKDYDDGQENMERWNRELGTKLGSHADTESDIPRMVEEAREKGWFLYEDEVPYQPRSAGGLMGDGEYRRPDALPFPEVPVMTPEREERYRREFFGRP